MHRLELPSVGPQAAALAAARVAVPEPLALAGLAVADGGRDVERGHLAVRVEAHAGAPVQSAWYSALTEKAAGTPTQ